MTTLKYGWRPEIQKAAGDIRKLLIGAGYLGADDESPEGLVRAVERVVDASAHGASDEARRFLLSVMNSNTHSHAERMHAAALLLQVKP